MTYSIVDGKIIVPVKTGDSVWYYCREPQEHVEEGIITNVTYTFRINKKGIEVFEGYLRCNTANEPIPLEHCELTEEDLKVLVIDALFGNKE